MTSDERTQLLDSLLQGDISEANFLRIEAELTVDPEVRAEYYRRLQLDLLLEQIAEQDPAPIHETSPSSPPAFRRFWLTGILVAVAAALLAVVTLPAWQNGKSAESNQTAEKTEPSASGFAVLSGQSNAVWADGHRDNGALIPPGGLHLVSGLAHLELFSGVQLVIRGDSEFVIESPMLVHMKSGQARAHVPEPAHGFRIRTSAGDIVDLGTELTIDVDRDRADVQVVDGEVEMHPREAESERLRDGQGMQLSADGTIAGRSAGSIELVGPTAFQHAMAERQSDRMLDWQSAVDALADDPRLVAHFLVDPADGFSRRLINRAHRSQPEGDPTSGSDASADRLPVGGDGAVVAAQRTEDRWGRTDGALDFSRMGSRVRVVVPGEHRGLTLYCWVKINSLDRWYNSLFLTDGHEGREPHWQIMDDGRMFFSVKPPNTQQRSPEEAERQIYFSPPFWNRSMSGQWTMLCTVYDVDEKRVNHFVNGNIISSAEIPEALLVDSIKIGAASICNWSEPMYRTDDTFVVRNLNGSIDEFALFSGALSEEEISRLYQAGNPE